MDNALAGIPEHVWRRELEKRAGAAACRAPSPEYFRWRPHASHPIAEVGGTATRMVHGTQRPYLRRNGGATVFFI